jgi:transcription elongation factor
MAFAVPRNPNRKRNRRSQRLDACLFDPALIEKVHGSDALERRDDLYIFENNTFRHGMLILNLQSSHTLDPVPFPSKAEIEPFVKANLLTREDALSMTSHEELAILRPDDHVVLTAGEKEGRTGFVIAYEDYIAYIRLEPDHTDPTVFAYASIHDIKRILYIENTIQVRQDAGELAGTIGRITWISDDMQFVEFIDDLTRTHVSLIFILNYAKDLTLSSTGSP